MRKISRSIFAIDSVLTFNCVVCFNNEVKLLGDGTQEPLVIAGDKLYNYDAILELGKTFKIANCIKESKDVLSKKLYELEETGSTALGPAVVVSR